LKFTDKKTIVQRLVTKIVATKQEVTIWGQIPILTTAQVGYEPINRNSWPAKCRKIYSF
jgi:hypothetical protein